jgi:hypothetical protein
VGVVLDRFRLLDVFSVGAGVVCTFYWFGIRFLVLGGDFPSRFEIGASGGLVLVLALVGGIFYLVF